MNKKHQVPEKREKRKKSQCFWVMEERSVEPLKVDEAKAQGFEEVVQETQCF